MKYLKILPLLLLPLFAAAQPLGTWPVQYGDTPPTHTPSGSGTRIYLNISTNELYNWNPAPVSSWVKYPKGFDQISGCAAPGYTPTARQSVFAVNSCTALQNGRGPELYQYTGSQWVCLNCYPAYTAGTGIGISSGVITNTAPDQVVSISGVGITPSGTYPNFTLTAADQSATNELQNLSLSGQSLGISSGTGVTIPVIGVIAGTGIGVSSSSGNFTVSNTGDLSATNELNTSFSVSGSNLALTDAGGTINVPVSSIAPVQAVAPGSGISISGTTTRTVTAADVSPTNELQTLSIVGQDLTLSNGGGTVTIPATTTLDASDIVVDNSAFSVLTATDAQTAFEQTDAALSNTLNTATSFGGDVSGTYDNLQLGSGVVGPTELASTAVTPGTYTNATVTFDADGRATSASSGTAPVTGSGTASYIPKWTGGTSLSSSIIYDNGTNIGIGTSSPTGIFHTYIPANTKGNLIEYNYQSGTSQRPFSLVNQDGLETVAFGANRTTNEGRLFLGSPSVQGGGSGIDFQSNLGASSKIGRFDLDNSGNMIFRQSQGSMFYDYFSNVYFRDNAFTTRFQIYGADINIGTSFSSAARLVLYGKGTTSSTYSAQFHNSSGSSNTLIIRDDGLIGAGTNSPASKIDILPTSGYAQLRLRNTYTPTGTSDALGSTGDTAWDDNYFYIKTSAGWKRTALSTF